MSFIKGLPLKFVKPPLSLGTMPTAAAAVVDGNGASFDPGANTAIWEITADSGSKTLGGYYYAAIRGNVLNGTAQGGAASTIGVLGTLNTNTLSFGGGDHYAVRGHLDHWGAVTMTGNNANVGAVSAYVENEGTCTVGTGMVLCGLQTYQVGLATCTGTGLNPAIWIRANATANAWQYGIYVPATSVRHVLMAGSQPGETSGYIIDGYGINLAKDYSAGTYTFGTQYRLYGIEVNTDTGGVDMTGDVNAGAIKGRHVIGTTQSNAGMCGVVGTLDIGTGVNIISNYQGVCGVVDFYGTSTIGGSVSHVAALAGTVWNEGATTLNSAGGGLFGLELVSNGAITTLTAGINPAINIRGGWKGIMHAGTSTDKISCGTTANNKFVSFYATSAATSGVATLNYGRLYITGAGAGGCAVRAYCDIAVVGASGGSGVQATLGVGESTTAYSVTGLGTGVYANIFFANNTVAGGTYAAINCELFSGGSNTNIAATRSSFIRFSDGGQADKISDYAYLFDLTGFTSGAAHTYYDKGSTITGNIYGYLKISTPAGDRFIATYVSLA